MAEHHDLESFRQQMLAQAQSKKRRVEEHQQQAKDARESKRLRGAKDIDAELVQDTMNALIEVAVPEVLEVIIISHSDGRYSLATDMRPLYHVFCLFKLNRNNRNEVLRRVELKTTMVIKVWKTVKDLPKGYHVLDSMLPGMDAKEGKKAPVHSIIGRIVNLKIEDMLLIDINQTITAAGAAAGQWQTDAYMVLQAAVRLTPPMDSFKKRYLRRYTATFTRARDSVSNTFEMTDFLYERFSRSFHPKRAARGCIAHAHCKTIGHTFQPELSQKTKDAFALSQSRYGKYGPRGKLEAQRSKGDLYELVEHAVASSLGDYTKFGGHVSSRYGLLLDRARTKELYEYAVERGMGEWEEYDITF